MKAVNEVTVWTNEVLGNVRTIEESGTMLYCLRDVLKGLGYKSPTGRSYKDLVCGQSYRRNIFVSFVREGETTSARRKMLFVTYDQLCGIMYHSTLPTAKLLRKKLSEGVGITWYRTQDLPTPRVTVTKPKSLSILDEYTPEEAEDLLQTALNLIREERAKAARTAQKASRPKGTSHNHSYR